MVPFVYVKTRNCDLWLPSHYMVLLHPLYVVDVCSLFLCMLCCVEALWLARSPSKGSYQSKGCIVSKVVLNLNSSQGLVCEMKYGYHNCTHSATLLFLFCHQHIFATVTVRPIANLHYVKIRLCHTECSVQMDWTHKFPYAVNWSYIHI